MTEPVAYEQFDQDTQSTGTPAAPPQTHGIDAPPDADLRRLSDVPVELSVEIGRTRMTVGETLQLRAGSIVTLERLAGEPVDLLVNGTPIARGEVVVVDEQFGLRVTEIVEDDSAQPLGAGDTAGTPAGAAGTAQADAAIQE
jgi:flagellar motor switch protein FliN/FliY